MNEYANWNARAYLDQFYRFGPIPADSAAIIDFVNSQLHNRYFERALDFGCGPSLYTHFAACKFYGSLTLSDYLSDNRQEILNWISNRNGCFNWEHYAAFALRQSGISDEPEYITNLENQLRRKTASVVTANVYSTNIVGAPGPWDLVMSWFCLECVDSDLDRWNNSLRSLFQEVNLGGTLLLASLIGSTGYEVAGTTFPAINLSKRDILKALEDLDGIDKKSIVVQEHFVPEWTDAGYNRIALCRADKLPKVVWPT